MIILFKKIWLPNGCFNIAANFNSMKKICLFLLAAMLCTVAVAQPKASTKPLSTDAAFADALNKVIQDYTSNFVHIQGSKMPVDVDADSYKSKICLPAAIGCKIMRYRSIEDNSANWQAGLYEGESFEDAFKLYKKVFSQVKKTAVKGVATSSAGFDGKMESVDENIGFAVSTLRLKTTNRAYKDLVVEVEMASNYTSWEVKLNVYTKKLIVEEKEESDKQ